MAQLFDTQRLLTSISGHPIMSKSLKYREEELLRKISELPEDSIEAKVKLLFHGRPVLGSMGIDASFAGKLVPHVEKMVNARFFQKYGATIKAKNKKEKLQFTKLYLTALPKGSFGIELTKLNDQNLFDNAQYAETLKEIATIIDASAKSDDQFTEAINDSPAQTLTSLKEFLHLIADHDAGVTIETGSSKYDLSIDAAKEAYDRVNSVIDEERIVTFQGYLRGLLLESWKFDFIRSDGRKISGYISDDTSEEDALLFLSSYLNKEALVTFEETKITFNTGKTKTTYKLLHITSLSGNV